MNTKRAADEYSGVHKRVHHISYGSWTGKLLRALFSQHKSEDRGINKVGELPGPKARPPSVH